MDWKEFLNPDRRKIVLFFVFLIIFTFVNYITFPGPETLDYRGVPFMYFLNGCVGEPGSPCFDNYYDQKNFVVDIIISLVISFLVPCLIVWIYDKVKKKSRVPALEPSKNLQIF